MFTRPSLRVVVATTAAAALLVGGANLTSYAATHHGNGAGASAASKSAQPKTITFHLGKQGQHLASGIHVFTAKVPKGTYSVSVSGVMVDASTGTGDVYLCTVADKKTFVHFVNHPSTPDFSRLYEVSGQSQSDTPFTYGLMEGNNPVAKIDRTKIAYGCILSGDGPYTMSRVPTFTLTPVKVTNKKGSPLSFSKTRMSKLLQMMR